MFLNQFGEVVESRSYLSYQSNFLQVLKMTRIPMARVRKPNPRAMPIYPISGRIHILLKESVMRIACSWVFEVRYRVFKGAVLERVLLFPQIFGKTPDVGKCSQNLKIQRRRFATSCNNQAGGFFFIFEFSF